MIVYRPLNINRGQAPNSTRTKYRLAATTSGRVAAEVSEPSSGDKGSVRVAIKLLNGQFQFVRDLEMVIA